MENYTNLVNVLNEKRNTCFRKTEDNNVYSGSIILNDGSNVTLRISFPESYPIKLPVFYVEASGLIYLHTDSFGKMCLFEESSMLLNQNNKEEILLECFDRACEILNVQSDSIEYRNEIKREFDAYWLEISKECIYSCIDSSQIVYSEKVISWVGSHYVLTESENDGKYFLYNYLKVNKTLVVSSNKCLVVRLRENSPLPKIGNVKWKEVRNYIVNNVSSSVKRMFRKYCSTEIKRAVKRIILILPSEAGDILFGYQIRISNKRYIKFENCTNTEVISLYIKRIDREYLLNRAGTNADDKDIQILLLGCGSVGGFIAENLCAAGVSVLDILDDDVFRTENVHRHILGIDAALENTLRNKADKLKKRLEQKYLYVDIDSLGYKDRGAENFIRNIERLRRYDIIISALGEPTINLEINRILYKNNISAPFVVCFNEPYGIGGHAIACNIEKSSCLRCLYTDLLSTDLVEFRGSFVEKGQSFKKNISGCGGAFVPYSRLDSQQTAIITTRLVLEILHNEITRNTVRSWVGSDNKLKEAGKVESAYYKSFGKGGIVSANIASNYNCPICGEEK